MNLWFKKIDGCSNSPERSSTTKIEKHNIPCGYSIWNIWIFDCRQNKNSLFCRKKRVKKFCESLRKQAKNIIDLEKKKNVTVSKKRTKITSRCNSMLYLLKQIYKKKFSKHKNPRKVRYLLYCLIQKRSTYYMHFKI